jgi:acyl-CoA hydrolase
MSTDAALDWRGRRVSAAEAVSVVRPGEKVFVGSACATPRSLVDALEQLWLDGVVLVHFLTDRVGRGDPPHTNYRHRVFYVGRDVRALHDVRALRESGLVEYLPLSLGEVPRLFRNGQIALDVAMVQVAPPGPDGTCSLGISVDVTKAAALAARTVIAEVNPAMPRTAGDSRIPVDRIACFVPVETPVVEYLHEPAGEVAEQIARYVARLIDDRSTLQVGLGRVPNEMLAHLTNRRDLASIRTSSRSRLSISSPPASSRARSRRAGRWARGASTTWWTTIPASPFIRSSTSATRPSSRAGSGWCR